MRDFKQLKVWQKSHNLTLKAYKVTKAFPREEIYGLTNQIRRASSSIPANIAEGCGMDGDAQFARFLQISMGSATELEYHFLLARDLGLIDAATYNTLNDELTQTKRMLTIFIQRVRARI
ncbi:MAG: four helix bundle protein [Chloroflexi bacterium]|nr:four helix bundle protein [Chloroflexota bacterium]